jgi:hypothetical protein
MLPIKKYGSLLAKCFLYVSYSVMMKNVLIHIKGVSHVTSLSKNYTILIFLSVMTNYS